MLTGVAGAGAGSACAEPGTAPSIVATDAPTTVHLMTTPTKPPTPTGQYWHVRAIMVGPAQEEQRSVRQTLGLGAAEVIGAYGIALEI
ncbi:hypothetical protein GCM10012280_54080 [Wenjunlia tyrosinilytica]|uniref:Uncharacterized protein n=1 Tax=Wenjunlia tyrosinilytica TaxID=1544741 RepID=A0A917ZUE0_9ACTN|nr:hypothetical protein GCM10012280_54080 [Wenjunlia tyrosinilytica]